MNVLKFLAVDRSLTTKREVVGRFQMRDECLLPQFAEPDDEAALEAAEVVEVPKPSLWRRLADWLTGRSAKTFAGEPALVVVAQEVESPVAAAAPAKPVKRGGIFSGAEAVTSADRKLEQVEFRFEHVRVICNDLHDADFEIVSLPVRKCAQPVEPAVMMATA